MTCLQNATRQFETKNNTTQSQKTITSKNICTIAAPFNDGWTFGVTIWMSESRWRKWWGGKWGRSITETKMRNTAARSRAWMEDEL